MKSIKEIFSEYTHEELEQILVEEITKIGVPFIPSEEIEETDDISIIPLSYEDLEVEGNE